MPLKPHTAHIIKDSFIIAISVLCAIALAKTGVAYNILLITQSFPFIGSFVAGMFFTSVFTTAPATIVLAQITELYNPFEVAFLGGLGAMITDFIIFRFIKKDISKDISHVAKQKKHERLNALMKKRLFRWLIPLLGALIIASPLPDELGLALLGLYKTPTRIFIPLSFAFNFLGILALSLAVRTLI